MAHLNLHIGPFRSFYYFYDSILSNTSYSVLLDQINNYYLDTLRKEISYYGFIIGINNITKFTPLDI